MVVTLTVPTIITKQFHFDPAWPPAPVTAVGGVRPPYTPKVEEKPLLVKELARLLRDYLRLKVERE